MKHPNSTLRLAQILSFILLLAFAMQSYAGEDGVATVVAVKGNVVAISADGGSRKLILKSPVNLNDTIKTGDRGRIQIMFPDNTLISLGRKTEMKMSEYEWDETNKKGKLKTKVNEGVFRVMGGKITKTSPEQFKTETPSATIGIRGSMYAGKVTPTSLAVVFQGGKGIDIINDSGRVGITKPGYGTHVELGKPPAPPTKFKPADMAGLNADLAGGTDEQADDEQNTDQPQDEGPPPDQTKNEDEGENQVGEEQPPADGEQQTAENNDLNAPADSTSDDGGTAASTEREPVSAEGEQPPVAENDQQSTPGDQPVTTDTPPAEGEQPPPPTEPVPIAGNQPPASEPVNSPSAQPTEPAPTMPSEPAPIAPAEPVPSDPIGPQLDPTGPIPTTPLEPVPIAPLDPVPTSPIEPVALDPCITNPSLCIDQPTSTASLPTDGIAGYKGLLTGTSIDSSNNSTLINGEMFFEVNWHSQKFLGLVFNTGQTDPNHPENPVFFFGDVDSATNGLTNVRIFGSDYDPDTFQITARNGSGFGSFYGSTYELFTFNGNGADHAVEPYIQPTIGSWDVSATGSRGPTDPVDLTSPTGPETWEGYFVGIADDMSNPSSNRRYFMNENGSDFQLNINKDTGTISGNMSGIDAEYLSTVMMDNITIGGSFGSAYILDDFFAALIGCSTNDCMYESGNTPKGLKNYGNYLITEAPDKQFVINPDTPQEDVIMTWGYWEIAYEDVATTKQYHAHIPSTLWLSGEKTASSVIDTMRTNNIIGNYTGFARGGVVDGSMYTELGGNASVTVDFGKIGVASDAVTAHLALYKNFGMATQTSEIILDATSGSSFNASTFGFSNPNAAFSNVGLVDGKFNGGFYGPNAEGVGGNFYADFGTKKYQGIYGAMR